MAYKQVSLPLTPNIQVVTLTNANEEHSITLSAGCQYFQFQCRTSAALRYAFVTGKVAGSTDPYGSLVAGGVFTSTQKYGGPITTTEGNTGKTTQTIYFAGGTNGLVVELVEWLAQ